MEIAVGARNFGGLDCLEFGERRVNISLGPNEGWYLMTGLREKAYKENEKYKEGKSILEKTRMWKEARFNSGTLVVTVLT
uniref:Uncharacterized protein n=1 Tax=Oryza glaberrima TaxID=4538 RepID=I1QTV4_ORYGL